MKYEIALVSDRKVVIRDRYPNAEHGAITDDAPMLCEALAPFVGNRHLEYLDAAGNRTRLVMKDGKLFCFGPPL